jgi:hypothetical protein
MKTDSEKKYTHVKDPQGTDYYCPLEKHGTPPANDIFDGCVEKDVVERYSGNIQIKEKKDE